jgi:hypothetical protein
MSQKYSYLLLEIGMFLTIWLLSLNAVSWKPLLTRRGLLTCISIFILWFALDQTGLMFRLWSFPGAGTLPIRIFGLPLEEYLIFIIHTLMCFMLASMFHAEQR